MSARIQPMSPPYPADIQSAFDRLMPPGLAPLALFTTLARDRRLWAKFSAGSLLDRGHLALRQREIAILRVTAKCGSEYEWGVHAAFFSAKAGLDDVQLLATVHGSAEAACWSADERALIATCDAVLMSCDIDEGTWARVRAVLAEDAIIEVILLVGFYRTVSALTKALRLPLEPFARQFPAAGPPGTR